jgi:hypothetical protein
MDAKLRNINWDNYDLNRILFKNYVKNENNEIKYTDNNAMDEKLIMYIDIHYLRNTQIHVTTPTMKAPFAFNKNTNLFYLQFTNIKTDTTMQSFYKFINSLELLQMKHIGITETNVDDYLSQIKYDSKKKYDPNLVTKVAFLTKQNRYSVSIFNKDKRFISIFNIPKFARVQCDIYIDKIWKYNGAFVAKWKVSKIYIL